MSTVLRKEGTDILINCPGCGEIVSDKAGRCPHCFYVFSQDEKEAPAKDKKHRGYLFLIVGLLIFVVELMRPRILYTVPAIAIVASLGYPF